MDNNNYYVEETKHKNRFYQGCCLFLLIFCFPFGIPLLIFYAWFSQTNYSRNYFHNTSNLLFNNNTNIDYSVLGNKIETNNKKNNDNTNEDNKSNEINDIYENSYLTINNDDTINNINIK